MPIPVEVPPVAKQPIKRRLKLTRQDFEKYGYTPGCSGCENAQTGSYGRDHSEECRKRITERIESTERGKAKVESAAKRMDEAVAEELEKNVTIEEPDEPEAKVEEDVGCEGRPAA